MPSTCKIFIEDLRLDAVLGVHPYERTTPQPLLISAELTLQAPPTADELAKTFCYDQLREKIIARTQDAFHLAETLAATIASDCLTHPQVQAVRIIVKKPHALTDAAHAGVEIFRTRD